MREDNRSTKLEGLIPTILQVLAERQDEKVNSHDIAQQIKVGVDEVNRCLEEMRYMRLVELRTALGPSLSARVTPLGLANLENGKHLSCRINNVEGSKKAQISLTGAKYCYINNNWVQRSESGILLTNSENNTISDNNVTLNKVGIRLENSNSNTILDNIIAYNYVFGISNEGSVTNFIYNNYFKNAENVEEKAINAENIWQSPLVTRQNIIKGPYIGGNYWANLNGTGYSETAVDENNNGICDSPYNIPGGGTDKFPLFPKVPNAVKNLDNKLNSTAADYEQSLADEKNKTKAQTPVNATNGTKEPSTEETPGFGLGVAVLAAVGAACFLRRDR